MLQFCAWSGSPTATTSLSCKTSSGILMPLVKDSQQLSLAYECVESIRGSVNGAVRKGGEVRKERPGSRVPLGSVTRHRAGLPGSSRGSASRLMS